MNHYTYVVFDPSSDMKYIGVRSCECPVDEDPYMGSSYAMTNEDRARCDKLVLSIFPTREEALAEEIRLHAVHEVHKNPEFWNMVKQTSTKFVSNRKGHKLTEEHKRKCSEALTGRKMKPFTEEHRQKLAKAKLGTKASRETRAKLSEMRKGTGNSRYKHSSVYEWVNNNGEAFKGTPLELIEVHAVNNSHIYGVLKGKRNYVNGWRIVKNITSGCATTDRLYIDSYTWVHVDGREFCGRIEEFRDFLGVANMSNIKKLVRKDIGSSKGWSIKWDVPSRA